MEAVEQLNYGCMLKMNAGQPEKKLLIEVEEEDDNTLPDLPQNQLQDPVAAALFDSVMNGMVFTVAEIIL